MSDTKEKKEKQPEGITSALLGGSGLMQAILETMELITEAIKSGEVSGKPFKAEAPMDIIQDEDLDDGDPVVQNFLHDGGCKGVVRIMRFVAPEEAVEKLASIVNQLKSVRKAYRGTMMRQIFAAVQAARGIDNEAVRLERLAHRMESTSRGFYQAEAVVAIDQLLLDSDANERRTLLAARNGILKGEDASLDAAAFRLRTLFASTLPEEKLLRVAYTTLSTQNGEPYLLCPKGKHVVGHPVPMEVSKCRENCIDSRMASDGSVSCQYQSWLKTADSHEKAMARLDVYRHPDNELNLLTLAKGEREKPWTEANIPLEKRFEDSTQGANKLRDKAPSDLSLEAQLDKAKVGKPGYRSENPTSLGDMNSKVAAFNFRRRVTAKVAAEETLEEQIRDQADNNEHEMHETPREQQLDETTSLNGRRAETNDESNDSLGAQIEDQHSDEPYGDEAIEKMLEDERVVLSEEEIDMLLEELLEKSRNK